MLYDDRLTCPPTIDTSKSLRSPRRAGRAPTVLVVDDEPGLRDVLSLSLEDAGFDVRTAADGLEVFSPMPRPSPTRTLSPMPPKGCTATPDHGPRGEHRKGEYG
jgi:hypothetical protein